MERRKMSYKFEEFHRATINLIVAGLLLTYGNSATRASVLIVAKSIYFP